MMQNTGNKAIKILLFFLVLLAVLLAGYSFFRKNRLKEAERKLSAVEKRLDTLLLQVEASQVKIDSMILRIDRTSGGISRLKTQVETIDRDYRRNSREADLRLNALKAKLSGEQEKLMALQEELRRLK